MKALNMKLAMSVVAIAMVATPALAKAHQQVSSRQLRDYAGTGAVQQNQLPQYPNGAIKSGSAAAEQSGADFNLMSQPD
jgi:hypothetical protein